MQPYKFTIHDVFEKERRYDIPLYQRAYVWNEEDQWEPLWEDIRKQAERCLPGAPEAKGTHFLGAAVWSNNTIVGRAIAKADVIDGQQRLTTLQLCIAALRDYATDIDPSSAEQAGRWTANPGRKGSDEELKVWPTNADREVFRAVMRAGSPAAVQTLYVKDGAAPDQALPRMAEAYLYFARSIRDFVQDGKSENDRADRVHAVVQAMRTALQFVVIELEPGDDPQIIFETLNARGQPLLPSDLVRNYVFLNATGRGGAASDKLYEDYWKAFDNLREPQPDASGEDRFWHIEERQGRLKRPRIDLFLFHYLTLKTDRELNIGQLFKEFREWHEEGDDSIETFLADLKAQSDRFKQLITPNGTDRLSIFARRLKALDTSTVYPVLMYLTSLPKTVLPADQFDRTIADLESYLVRRLICGLTSKNYNKFFLGLLVKAKKAVAEGASVSDAVRDELLRSAEKTATWPTDDEFKKAWLGEPVYLKTRTDRAAMVLRALEESMRTAKNEAVSLPVSLTIEHLLPQKFAIKDYPYAVPMPLKEDETPERCRARVMHAIGNLTLLTQSLNTAVSNGPFVAKSAAIAAESDLRLNAWLRAGAHTVWSETEIATRATKLFEFALVIWSRPPDTRKRETADPTQNFTHFKKRFGALIDAGVLKDGEPLSLVYKGKSFTGQASRDGLKMSDGVYSPTEAAKRCYASVGTIRQSENGWRVWKTSNGQTLKELLLSIGDDAEDDEAVAPQTGPESKQR